MILSSPIKCQLSFPHTKVLFNSFKLLGRMPSGLKTFSYIQFDHYVQSFLCIDHYLIKYS